MFVQADAEPHFYGCGGRYRASGGQTEAGPYFCSDWGYFVVSGALAPVHASGVACPIGEECGDAEPRASPYVHSCEHRFSERLIGIRHHFNNGERNSRFKPLQVFINRLGFPSGISEDGDVWPMFEGSSFG